MKTRTMPRLYILKLLKSKSCDGETCRSSGDYESMTADRYLADKWLRYQPYSCGCMHKVYIYSCERELLMRRDGRRKQVA